jgi:hypothetical protein
MADNKAFWDELFDDTKLDDHVPGATKVKPAASTTDTAPPPEIN